MNDEQKPKNGNGLSKVIAGLLSGDNTSKIIALIILAISSGNWFEIKRVEAIKREDIERALAEVHNLHEQLIETLNRQKAMYEIIQKLAPK